MVCQAVNTSNLVGAFCYFSWPTTSLLYFEERRKTKSTQSGLHSRFHVLTHAAITSYSREFGPWLLSICSQHIILHLAPINTITHQPTQLDPHKQQQQLPNTTGA